MYHSGRKHLKSNFGGFIRLASLALVGLYAYYILVPELDSKDKDFTMEKVMSSVEAGFDPNQDEDQASLTGGTRRNLGSAKDHVSRQYNYEQISIHNQFTENEE